MAHRCRWTAEPCTTSRHIPIHWGFASAAPGSFWPLTRRGRQNTGAEFQVVLVSIGKGVGETE